MRDPNRINLFCNDLALYWRKYFPDMRFGQLMCNFFGWVASETGKRRDPFYPEEEKMIEYFKEYCEMMTRKPE